MKLKIKFQNIFVILSILFMFGCCCFFGYRLVKYYRVFNPKNESGEKTEIFSATVRQNNPVITEGDGLYIHNGDFVFKGEKVDNYVKYNNKLWRIVQVMRAGSVKLVLEDSLTEMEYDVDNKSYNESIIYSYIKDQNNLKIDTKQLDKMTVCLDNIDDASKPTCNKTISEYVALLSISDYINSVNTTTSTSYLNSSDNMWLYNKTSTGLAWNISNSKLTSSKTDNKYSVRPVITLGSKAHSDSGDGTKNKPYVVKDGE